MSSDCAAPLQIKKAHSDLTAEVEHLLTGRSSAVRCSRVCHFADSLTGTPAAMRQVADRTDGVWLSVELLKDVRVFKKIYMVLFFSKGLSSFGGTSEPLGIIYENVPFVARGSLFSKKNTGLVKRTLPSMNL